MLSIIAAMDKNYGIGYGGKLPWRLPADLKRFKDLTRGHAVLMGRKTYESIGRPLPERRNIVITRDKNFSAPGCEIAASLAEAIALAGDGEAFVIGGGEIYSQAMPFSGRLYITEVEGDFQTDTFFPKIDLGVWEEESRESHEPDEKNPHKYGFVVYGRKK